ncbi:DUF86 domain-containing protein [Bacillus salitolerans]|uniref:DUF86 domain-containing protein n=1 Tax=Bacillus salitolerans TaxID=1437434 RepID=A0ABW4LSK4_9BACI
MYFVDRAKIEETLTYLEKLTHQFSEVDQWDTGVHRSALERIGHLMIESILDVGNAMIDGFIMRDPGSYEDIIDILEDEKVISPEDALSLKSLISFRKVLVQEYTNVNHQKLHATIEKEWKAITVFPDKIRNYLLNELGPVSAFIPQQHNK